MAVLRLVELKDKGPITQRMSLSTLKINALKTKVFNIFDLTKFQIHFLPNSLKK